jgi:hypothetical protein
MSSSKPATKELGRSGAGANEAHIECGIPAECERVVPLWIILLDNVPTAAMFVLGTILVWRLGWLFGAAYLVYCVLAIVAFWGRICPWCHHFNTHACPCGYGAVAPLLFDARKGRDFRSVFRANIVVMFPCFFVPAIAGAWLVWNGSARSTVAILAAFCILAFVAIPMISRLVGCKGCDIKDECPWMTQRSPVVGVQNGRASSRSTPADGSEAKRLQ